MWKESSSCLCGCSERVVRRIALHTEDDELGAELDLTFAGLK